MRNRMLKRGFTLIEVLIVVLIIGILAAIIIPRYTDTTELTQESAIRASLRTIRSQIEFYRNREGGFPAEFDDLWDGTPIDNDGDPVYYLMDEPQHPGPGEFQYEPETGSIWSDTNEDW